MRIRALTLAAAIGLPTTLAAQTTVGTMSGTLEGPPAAYSILDGEDIATGWREVEDGVEVTLEAYPAETPVSDDQRLTVTFTADPGTRSPDLISGQIELMRDGEALTATDDAINLSVDSFEIQGDSLLIDGNMRATLAEGEEDVSVVSSEGITLSVDLQATVIRAEGD
ncbi:hypothetical protein [Palleronia abyssalis]|uniref:Uncharacterized protein n=1 Tax=Palleronia abyssalis TaxID=1501240 RepID=A0A2R8BT79_9RHOB|nr:hypothetical protein [Palleronia abyssalis]SPJ23328.1 hypothetical protein PAA8504_01138 [Palleronia abyssalis]